MDPDIPLFEQMRHQADQLHFKFKDFIVGSAPNSMAGLEHEVRELVEDFEKHKHPRTIEARIKAIQIALKQASHIPHGDINYHEFDYLYDAYEHMRRALREFHSY